MMRKIVGLVWVLGTIAFALSGCAARKGEEAKPATAAAAAVSTTPSGLAYESASTGLPIGRIWKSQIAFGDVNADGFPDIGIVSRLADGPWIFVNDGKGNWTPASEGLPREIFCGGGMDFADINNDGNMDVAIADHCKGVYVFLGDGAGHWRTASSGLPNIGSEDVALGDFDGDGCSDLVSVAASEEGVRAFRGDCKGTWRESSEGLALTEWGNSVVFGDIDNDGNLDIAAAYSAGPRAWLGDGKGAWREASEGLPAPEIHGLYWGIAVGDLNGDGQLDLVSGSQMPPQPDDCGTSGAPICVGGGVEAFLRQDDGSWKFANEGLLPMNALGVTTGDLNNDGNTDIIAVGKAALSEIGGVYGVFPYLGDGTGKWRPDDDTGLPSTGRMRTWGVNVADIDRDGVLDVGVAFGDVVSPGWRSGGSKTAGNTTPQRGKFGGVEVWRGQISDE